MRKGAALTIAHAPNRREDFIPMGPTARSALFIEMEVNDVKLKVLMDTGSAISQIPEVLCRKNGWTVYENVKMKPVQIQSVYGEVRTMQRKYAWLHIKLNEIAYKHCMWVGSDEQPVLIGMDFLAGKPLLYDFQGGVLVAGNMESFMDPEVSKHFSSRQEEEWW